MGFLGKIFSAQEGPSERQIQKALKQVTQVHGEAATRVGAMERLASWRTPQAAAALLRRFTVQTPQASMDLEEKQYAVRLLAQMGNVAVQPILSYLHVEPDVTYPVRALRDILPPEEFHKCLTDILISLSSGIYALAGSQGGVYRCICPTKLFLLSADTVIRSLEDEDDDVCIAAIDYLARNGDETIREKLIQVFLESEVAAQGPRTDPGSFL